MPTATAPFSSSQSITSTLAQPNYQRPPGSRGQRPPREPSLLHAHYENNIPPPASYSRSFPSLMQSYPQSSSPMFSYSPPPPSWHPPIRMMIPSTGQHEHTPPQIPHKVWILDCKSCGTFLTNRGMKAVLLLRPNVSLFSTDALPVNCSAFTTNPAALRGSTPCRPSTSHVPPRTCECLTQTLCCHGCGSSVGYMIVIPCTRCTSSITATNRATNGHRFVFHSSEIVSTERHYISDEPGVNPFEAPASPPLPHTSVPSQNLHFHPHDPSSPFYLGGHRDLPTPLFTSPQYPQRASPEHLPTPPLESSDLAEFSRRSSSSSDGFPFTSSRATSPRHAPRPPVPHSTSSHPHPAPLPIPVPSQSIRAPFLLQSPPSYPYEVRVPSLEHKEPSSPKKLRAGDVLYWHQLARNGEIPGVAEDERARGETLNGVAAGPVIFNR